ncbi:MAG: response regulator [Candidatus Promineifilaceae bacterium]|nr:response regulator [Candidatus Promineifilaceae bacterium]
MTASTSPRDSSIQKLAVDMDQLLQAILLDLEQVVPFNSACIMLVHGSSLKAVAGRGFAQPDQVIGQTFPASDPLTQRVLTSKEPIILPDVRQEKDFQHWGGTEETRGWMAVPLRIRKRRLGYLTLDSDRERAFGTSEATLAMAFANQAAMTIDNARLYVETQRLLHRAQLQRAQLQQVMDLVPDGILVLDRAHKVILTNRAAQDSLANLADAEVGQILTHLGKLDIDTLLEQASASSAWQETTGRDQERLYEVSARPLVEGAAASDWLVLLRDVTAERQQEAYLRTQERLATVGQLASGIAHDFNNIMAVISLYSQLVLRTPDLTDKDRHRLETIFAESQQASQLIRRILDFSRQSDVQREPLELAQFLRDLTQLLRRTLPESIQIQLVVDDGEFPVLADAQRIQQMLMNLAVNARDAMPAGGTLTFHLAAGDQVAGEQMPLPDMDPGQWYRLEVADTGSGMSEEVRAHIFEPFFTTKPVGEGTGLGLAQVYGIVKQHDGHIDFRSAPGKGTTFSLYLPAYVEPPPRQAVDAFELVRGSGETILIVEDDQPTREAMAEILEMLSYAVYTAADGEQALRTIAEHDGQFDLVLSDMIMPTMGGAALHQKIREQFPHLKMIVVTGYPLEGDGQALLRQGIVDYVQKPPRVEEIASAVHAALRADD